MRYSLAKALWLGVIFSALLIVSSTGLCAVHFVRPNGATYGLGNGNDWNNAYSGLPDQLIRGDTYYIAGGIYTQVWDLDDVEDRITVITIKKANASECSNVPGWQPAFASEQAIVYNPNDGTYGAAVSIRTGYYVIDGVTGSGKKGYGIKLRYSTPDQYNNNVVIRGKAVNEVTLRHIEFEQAGSAHDYGQWGIHHLGGTFSNLHVQYCYAHDFNVFMKDDGGGGTIIEHCYFKDQWSSSNHHGELISIVGTDGLIFRYNICENTCNGTGGIIVLGTHSSYGDVENVEIYGNVFFDGGVSAGDGLWATGNSVDPCGLINWKIYNNTIVNNMAKFSSGKPGTNRSSGNVLKNNLYYGCNVSFNADPDEYTAEYNYYNNCTNVPSGQTGAVYSSESTDELFENYIGKNFRLKPTARAVDRGSNLSERYSEDIDGTTRPQGAKYDIGAYECIKSSPSPPRSLRIVHLD